MSLLNDLINMFTGHTQTQAAPQSGQMLGPIAKGIPAARQPLPQAQYAQYMNADGSGGGFGPNPPAPAPDITYNPNPNTNIPYSAHTPQLAQLGNQYVKNPTAPQFIGVDPAQFGFPADNTVQAPHAMGNNFNPQGAGVNPGYIPLQNSGFGGPGYAANLQPTFNPVTRNKF